MSDTNDIEILLSADNSNGKTYLALTHQPKRPDYPDDEYWFTLFGDYKDLKDFQIDFTEISLERLEEIKIMIDLVIEQANK